MTPKRKSDDAKPAAYQTPHVSTIGRIDELSLVVMEKFSDEQLMEALVAGHGSVMEALFDQYHRLVLSISSKILRDAWEAEDVMQEVFFEVYRKAHLFKPARGSFKVWLLQYAYHRSFNRREWFMCRRYHDHHPVTAAEHLSPKALNQFAAFAKEERLQILRKSMERLTEKQRTTLKLAVFEGLVLKEIAERMNEPRERVSNYYFRGLKKLKDAVRELLENNKAVLFPKDDR